MIQQIQETAMASVKGWLRPEHLKIRESLLVSICYE